MKAEKHKEAYERQKAAKRTSYDADRRRARHLASQEGSSQATQGEATDGEPTQDSQIQEERSLGPGPRAQEGALRAQAAGGGGLAPQAARSNPPPAGQKREAEGQTT